MVQIPFNAAILVGIIVESVLYGISVLMFLWTLWALFHNNSNHINKVMLTVTGVLFFLGTFHLVVDARRAYLGFIVSESYLADTRLNTLTNSIYGVETVVADAVLIYRCFIVWRDFRIIVLPIILWLATIVTAVHTIWSIAQPASVGQGLFVSETARWVASFYSMALATNILSTTLLAYRLWRVNAAVNTAIGSLSGTLPMNPKIRSALLVILECGALYSFSLIIMLIVYFSKSNGVYMLLDIIAQIIPIAFYAIIIRMSLHRLTENQRLTLYNQQYSSNYMLRSPRNNISVRVDEVVLAKSDTGSASAVPATPSMKSNHSLTW